MASILVVTGPSHKAILDILDPVRPDHPVRFSAVRLFALTSVLTCVFTTVRIVFPRHLAARYRVLVQREYSTGVQAILYPGKDCPSVGSHLHQECDIRLGF